MLSPIIVLHLPKLKKMRCSKLKMILVIVSLYSVLGASAQSGTVYLFLFRIDPELTNYEKVEINRKWFSGYSESDAMPHELIDSIKNKTEQAFTTILKIPVKMCFNKKSSDEIFTPVGSFGWLEGLPSSSFKKAIVQCPQNNRYIKLEVQIYASGGSSITMVKTKTKLSPKVQLYAKVFNENGDVVWKKDVVLKNFEKLRSETNYYDGYDITKSEVLSPLDIYAMYRMALNKLVSEL